jgi:uncharacterized DUF497 family protein
LQYNFEWDPKKAALNLRKHKISFENAAEVFLDPLAISIYDEEHSGLEDRWITLGKSSENVTLVVVHTFLEQGRNRFHIRMISARKATKKERKQYEEGGQ